MKDSKFGTFAGVYTPSVLTILGVIMYLRLPAVVGDAGLYGAVGIIVVAHVISVTTGLSISSIATDKRVGAGGPYYIVSRSLGLPIGGTLGLALFAGLAFSISLYIIGFSESFLAAWGFEVTKTTIRICGTLTLIVLTVLTLISTALAIKTQYFILGAIGLSIVAIFFGGVDAAPAQTQLAPPADGPPLELLFGIFFPAVTGFTAGVNMSGDLKNPNRAIPLGTMLSIATGFAVYISLAVFLAYRIPREQLADPQILTKMVVWAPLVIAGIWGATLSSALGSVLGAPRILQAVAGDRIAPRFLARGHGPLNEPRIALLFAITVGFGGILIAELNAIAGIVSMIFLATYGLLNISCAIESWASPDFRPAFRIPRFFSVLGAVTCVLVMIQLDLPSMLGATVVMAGLFVYLKRRQLTLESGDTWGGFWSSVIRTGLARLSTGAAHQRHWRPNVMLFRAADRDPARLLDFGANVVAAGGLLTDFALGSRAPPRAADDDQPHPGVFRRSLPVADPVEAVTGACAYAGLPGMAPNTVLLDWHEHNGDPDLLDRLAEATAQADQNLAIIAQRDGEIADPPQPRIDIWWHAEAGNLPLCLALVRSLTASGAWRRATARVLIVSGRPELKDEMTVAARRLFAAARVTADVEVLDAAGGTPDLPERILKDSSDAAFVLAGWPVSGALRDQVRAAIPRLLDAVPRLLFVAASSDFPQALRLWGAEAPITRPGDDDDSELASTPLQLPGPVVLAEAAAGFAREHDEASVAVATGVAQYCERERGLLQTLSQEIQRQFDNLEKSVAKAPRARIKRLVGRSYSAYLFQGQKHLAAFEAESVPAQRGMFEARLEALDALVGKSVPWASPRLSVARQVEDFRKNSADPARLRRLKWRRRVVAFVTRSRPTYPVDVETIRRFYLELRTCEMLRHTLHQVATESHRLAVSLGKILSASRASFSAIAESPGSPEALKQFIGSQREQALSEVSALMRLVDDRISRHKATIARTSRALAQEFSDDIDRLDVKPVVRQRRRATRKAPAIRRALGPLPELWAAHQRLLLERAQLALRIAEFQQRATTIVQRAEHDVALQLRSGVLSETERLRTNLQELLQATRDGVVDPEAKFKLDFGARVDVKELLADLVRETQAATDSLPESSRTLSDADIQQLENGAESRVTEISLAVRRLAQYLVEAELISPLQEQLASLPIVEQRTISTAQDVLRLVVFGLSEATDAASVSDPTLRDQLVSALESGIDRLGEVISAVETTTSDLSTCTDDGLRRLVRRTDPYELTSSSGDFGHYIRSHESRRALSKVRAALRTALARTKGALVRLLYRRSAGQLAARRMLERGRTNIVDRVRAMVDAQMPRQRLGVPAYYRQLFAGQATMNEAFWVERPDALARARAAVEAHRRGVRGALVVTGDYGSGKTALCQAVAGRLFPGQKVFRVHPPPGGTTDPNQLRRALERATGHEGDFEAIFSALPERSVVLLDAVELWWERSRRGLVVIEQIANLVDRFSDRVFFIINLGQHALRLIDRVVGLSDRALAVLWCEPLPAETLKSIITLRHASSGMRFRAGSRDEDQLTPWNLARLFTSFFEYTGGHVGAALRAWLSHVDRVDGKVISVRRPKVPDTSLLAAMRPDWLAVLLQLVCHRQMTFGRLQRASGLEGSDLRRDVDTLVLMGVVVESREGVLELNGFTQHFVLSSLRTRGVLA